MTGPREPAIVPAGVEPAAADTRPDGRGPHRRCAERGSATVWVICILTLISAAAGWALVRLAAESTRHTVERAADSAALAAATQALHRLATRSGPDPCGSAEQVAQRVGAQLTACSCTPLDCTVSVRQATTLIGALAAGFPELRGLGPIQAASRAGPVGESS
jgi:secretion/DNA translocation related TadE-like protein